MSATQQHLNNRNVLHTSSSTSAVETIRLNGDATPVVTRTEHPSAVLRKVKSYLMAVRPWSFSASLVPTILGVVLACRSSGPHELNIITVLLAILTVIMVHGAGNFVNTYHDYVRGIDNRRADDRTLVDHILSREEVVSLGATLYMGSFISFMLLAVLSPSKMEHLALIYFGGLSFSFLYSGFKYIALGEILTLITFGPISVLFAFMTQAGRIEWATIYYAIPLALNTEAILHSNNTRDIENDRTAGIVTLAIIIGHSASQVLYAALLFIPYIVFVVLALKFSLWFLLPLVTLPEAFRIERMFRRQSEIQSVPKLTAILNIYFGISYVIACILATQLPALSTGH